MRLTIGCNWDERLIDEFAGTDVKCLFGKLDRDIIGGGRPTYLCRSVTREYATNYIQKAKKAGIEFNYLLNAACLGNMEFNTEWHNQMLEFIDWVVSTGAKRVSVAVPYLIELIKKRYPELHVSASTFARINTVQRAKYFEELGADEITLDIMINRDFKMLKAIRKSVNCELTLLVNNTCLFNCPYSFYHAEMHAHSSQEKHESQGYCQEYCLYSCTKQKYSDPVELIRSRWIRPEDLKFYEEEIGINQFKVVDRLKETSWILNTVNAYLNRSYKGNLAEILNLPVGAIQAINEQFAHMTKKEAELGLGEFVSVIPFIDNSKLDGFLAHFKQVDCSRIDCNDCNYCTKIAQEVISMPDGCQKIVANFAKALDMMKNGEFIIK